MATVGAIVVELQANTAQFHQEMGKASSALHEVGESSSRGERRLVSFAARGIGVIVPEAEGATHALLGLVESATKASGVFALLAKSGLVAGVGVGAFLVGQKLGEEIDNWLRLGETSKQTLDRLSKELEENTKFLEKRSVAVNLAITLEGKLAVARANASAAATKGPAGEDTAESIGAALEARLAAITTAQKLEEASIRKITELGAQRDSALLASEMAARADRFAATADFYSRIGKLAEDASKKETELFAKGTTLLLDGLKNRLDLRKQLEAKTTTLVESGAIVDPLRGQQQTAQNFKDLAEGFAFLLKSGRTWNDLQDQIFAKEQELQNQGFPGFAQAVVEAGQKMERLGLTTRSIDADWFSLSKRVGDDMPAAVNRADPAIQTLIQRFQQMRAEAELTTRAVATLANTIAVGGNAPTPEVAAPVDLGVNP